MTKVFVNNKLVECSETAADELIKLRIRNVVLQSDLQRLEDEIVALHTQIAHAAQMERMDKEEIAKLRECLGHCIVEDGRNLVANLKSWRGNMGLVKGDCDEEQTKLRADLAEREAEIAKIREALEVLWAGSDQNEWDGKAIEFFKEALSTPSTSYLEQWEKERYGEPRSYLYKINTTIGGEAWTHDPRSRECLEALPLYARKD
jgi:DNA repair exonuclease SbcCD ATPase subunit